MATSNNSSVTLIPRGNIRPNTIGVGGGKAGDVADDAPAQRDDHPQGNAMAE